VRLRYASIYDCRHNRARIYRVNQRSLYAASRRVACRLWHRELHVSNGGSLADGAPSVDSVIKGRH
jgi:hypothetical protein